MLTKLRGSLAVGPEFLSEARARGLSTRQARLIGPSATAVSPDDPGLVLQSRELMERTALHAAVGEAENLELSYKRVERLAGVFEELGLTRHGEVPDPFRRLWIRGDGEDRTPGVSLTCENGEIAILCPAGARKLGEGTRLELSDRGLDTGVRLPLRLVDSCLFPGGLMIHLARPQGEGSIGRGEPRYDVDLEGSVRRLHEDRPAACAILDMSLTGLRMACSERFEVLELLALTVWIGDGGPEPMTCGSRVCWLRERDDGQIEHGLEFDGLPAGDLHRLQAWLQSGDDEPVVLID